MTYTVINLVMFCILGFAYVVVRPKLHIKALLCTILFLLLLTIVFDNLIIAAHIVAYHSSNISGLYIYKMPIEDLTYAVAACLLVPLLWGRDKTHAR